MRFRGLFFELSRGCADLMLISNVLARSAEQVTERLDRLIMQIREIQEPYMHGKKGVDVVLARFSFLSFSF